MSNQHFVYIWFDKTRKMYYIGKHFGDINDGYISSSRWLTGEIKYRPNDFKRRIFKICESEIKARKIEAHLLSLISDSEWGIKYYNLKSGKPKGTPPWNKGKTGIYSEQTIKKIGAAKIGNTYTKGRPNPLSSVNARKGANKQSATVTGRRKVVRNGKSTWAYPSDPDYPTT